MKNVSVSLGAQSYVIQISRGLMSRIGSTVRRMSRARRAAVIADSSVDRLYGAAVQSQLEEQGFETSRLVFSAGECSKNTVTLAALWGRMAALRLTRSDLVLTLGGGVTGDLGGFAAATYMRGLSYIQVPTTLLAQIDSSVGGKVAVDLPEGKNLAGCFCQPLGVLIDPLVLRSLPVRVLHDGLGEAVKYGCIADAGLFAMLESLPDDKALLSRMEEISARCCEIKARIVEQDPLDRGARMVLNFGHTVGHAMEKSYGFEKYTHGECVAAGMCTMARAGEQLGLTERGTAERIERLLKRLGLPTNVGLPAQTVIDAVSMDKKRGASGISLVLLKNIGQCFIRSSVMEELPQFINENTLSGAEKKGFCPVPLWRHPAMAMGQTR